MKRKLIVLFDGTWNSPKDETNVTKIKECLDSRGKDDTSQPYFYDKGVGTHFYDRLTGGAFGRGLSRNIMQGYKWLCETYKEEDEIFLFGFSRGAYTARSLVGLIRKCGLLNEPKLSLILQAYELYRDKKVHPNAKEAVAFRKSFSREVRIKFIGVWDTVGALGIPLSHVPFGRDYYQWHDTDLSKIVDYAYHAVALDEHRKDYMATMWTKIKPQNKDVEQRWFIGAHADVGGGYKNDPLRNIPCRWIAQKAQACGLKFKKEIGAREDDYLAPIHDSYSEFMFGMYKIVKHEYYRPIGTGVNEVIDESVWKRWENDQNYRPVSLNSGSKSSIEELLRFSGKDEEEVWKIES